MIKKILVTVNKRNQSLRLKPVVNEEGTNNMVDIKDVSG